MPKLNTNHGSISAMFMAPLSTDQSSVGASKAWIPSGIPQDWRLGMDAKPLMRTVPSLMETFVTVVWE